MINVLKINCGLLPSSVSLFLEIHITKIEASLTQFAFVIFILQLIDNDMFSIEMDPRVQFRPSKGLEKH